MQNKKFEIKADAMIEKAVEKKSEIKKVVKEEVTKATKAVNKPQIPKQTSIYIQYNDLDVKTEDLFERVKMEFVQAGNRKSDFRDVNIYIKPAEKMVYYVINGDFKGMFSI